MNPKKTVHSVGCHWLLETWSVITLKRKGALLPATSTLNGENLILTSRRWFWNEVSSLFRRQCWCDEDNANRFWNVPRFGNDILTHIIQTLPDWSDSKKEGVEGGDSKPLCQNKINDEEFYEVQQSLFKEYWHIWVLKNTGWPLENKFHVFESWISDSTDIWSYELCHKK